MRIVGLTGGIACGKSSVSSQLRDKGVPIVDADKIARDVVMKGTRGYRRVVAEFGDQILQEDATVHREKLGQIVFNDPVKRRKLNQALQPLIGLEILRQLAWLWLRGCHVAVLDAPLLFETGIHRFTRPIVVVSCDQQSQEGRLMRRDKLGREAACQRIAAQQPLEHKCRRADIVVDNSGTMQELQMQVDGLYQKIVAPLCWRERIFSRSGVAGIVSTVAALVVVLHRR